MWHSQPEKNQPGRTVRYVLIDTDGPVAEFDSWEAASDFLRENRGQGSIIRSERAMNPWGVDHWPEGTDPARDRPTGPLD